MRFFFSFLALLVVILLVVRFKPQTPPDAEPIIPTQQKEASGSAGEDHATPVPPRAEDQHDGRKDSVNTNTTSSMARPTGTARPVAASPKPRQQVDFAVDRVPVENG